MVSAEPSERRGAEAGEHTRGRKPLNPPVFINDLGTPLKDQGMLACVEPLDGGAHVSCQRSRGEGRQITLDPRATAARS